MSTEASPHSLVSVHIANGRQDVNGDNHRVQLAERVHLYEGSYDDFFNLLVPCSTPYAPSNLDVDNNGHGPFHEFNPSAGQELSSYDPLVSLYVHEYLCGDIEMAQIVGLDRLVSGFGEHKLSFLNTHDRELSFPFHAFSKNHQTTKPDIVVSFPGQILDEDTVRVSQWGVLGSVMELKPEEKQDPFQAHLHGKTGTHTIAQLARSARNLMSAHGFLAAYVVGIYGESVRIARFDHSSAVVCESFHIKERPDLLQRFFWHFTHPIDLNVVVPGTC